MNANLSHKTLRMSSDSAASNPALAQNSSRRRGPFAARPVEFPEQDVTRRLDGGEDVGRATHDVVRANHLPELVFIVDPVLQRDDGGLVSYWVRGHKDNPATVDLLIEALREAQGEARLRAEIEDALAWANHMAGDLKAAARHARSAADIAESLGEASILARALANVGLLDFLQVAESIERFSSALSLSRRRVRAFGSWASRAGCSPCSSCGQASSTPPGRP